MKRFEALDSWRGVAACAVVIHHLHFTMNWSLQPVDLVLNFYLFVDFFFVLSGFVITASYQQRFRDGYGLIPFMAKRFGRIYPLHLATLLTLVAVRFVFPFPASDELSIAHLYESPSHYDAPSFLVNLGLLQAFGLDKELTWNFPSWSISAEFYTYVLFALVWAFLRRLAWAGVGLILVLSIGGIAAFGENPDDLTTGVGLLRCLYGFACGVATYHVYERFAARSDAPIGTGIRATIVELVLALVILAFLKVPSGRIQLLGAPILYAAVVLMFAFEAGRLSAILKLKPLVLLGRWSYSIYLVHVVVLTAIAAAIIFIENAFGITLTVVDPRDANARIIGTSTLIGDAGATVIFIGVLALSALTHGLIEDPGRKFGRRIATTLEGRRKPHLADQTASTKEPATEKAS